MSNQPQAHVADEQIDLDRLEELARAATPGDWTAKPQGRLIGGPMRHYVNGSGQAQIAAFSVTYHDQAPDDEPERQQANTDFCAAFSPATALRLIKAARAAIPAGGDVEMLKKIQIHLLRAKMADGGMLKEIDAVLNLVEPVIYAIAAGAPAETPKPVLPCCDVIEMLLDVARAAFDAMDSTEENDNGLRWDRASFDDLSAAVDKLDALPDDQPGYVMGPAAKAGWALQQAAQPAPASATDARDGLPPL